MTCLGPDISATLRERITSHLQQKKITLGTFKTLAKKNLSCIEIPIEHHPDINTSRLTKELLEIVKPFSLDIFIQADTPARRDKRLIVLDMDSTLIQVEVIDELAKALGIGEAVAAITHRAMNGELNFNESLIERVGLLKGLSVEVLESVYQGLPFTLGAEPLLAILQKRGYKTGVLSGGFDYFTSRIKSVLKLNYAYSNRLGMESGRLTGEVIGDIVNGDKKATFMEKIAKEENIPLEQVIAIGDGANDLPMINKAGLGIAFNAKPAVRAAARYSITQKSLLTVLYLLGFSEEEITALSDEYRRSLR